MQMSIEIKTKSGNSLHYNSNNVVNNVIDAH